MERVCRRVQALTLPVHLTRRQVSRPIHPVRLIQQGLCLRIAQRVLRLNLMEPVYRADQALSRVHL